MEEDGEGEGYVGEIVIICILPSAGERPRADWRRPPRGSHCRVARGGGCLLATQVRRMRSCALQGRVPRGRVARVKKGFCLQSPRCLRIQLWRYSQRVRATQGSRRPTCECDGGRGGGGMELVAWPNMQTFALHLGTGRCCTLWKGLPGARAGRGTAGWGAVQTRGVSRTAIAPQSGRIQDPNLALTCLDWPSRAVRAGRSLALAAGRYFG